MHDIPWPIVIKGRDLWQELVGPLPISIATFDAITRLLQDQDMLMYKNSDCHHRQWRHILPASFVVSTFFHMSN